MAWYRESFGKDYLEVYAHRDDRQGSSEADAILRMLTLERGMKVLDVGCGTGRHSVSLEEAGLRVTGIDLSIDLLRSGRSRLDRPNDVFVRGDMRRLPFRAAFDAAVSLFTSFGYFDDSSDDGRVLREIRGVLRPGGRFLLDFLNAPRVIRTLVPHSEVTRKGVRIIEDRAISPDGLRVEKTIRLEPEADDSGDPSGDGTEPSASSRTAKTFRESVRLYDKEALVRLVADAGFEVLDVFGSFAGEPHDDDTPRTIVTARRLD